MNQEIMNTEEDDEKSKAFSFGEPVSSLAPNPAKDLLGIATDNNEYYNPALPFKGLALLSRVSPQQSPLALFIAENVAKYLKPNPIISRTLLQNLILEDQTFGNCFPKLIKNRNKKIIGCSMSPAINTRVLKKGKGYCFIQPDKTIKKYKKGEILHIKQYDPMQNIYGSAHWIGCIQSCLLSEEVRLFPRRLFNNGAIVGNLIFTAGLPPKDRKIVNQQFEKTKGSKNFSSLAFHFPKGKIEEMIKVVNLSEHAAKIDFSRLATMAGDDILKAWGVRPELLGQMPSNGSSGDLDKMTRAHHDYKSIPIKLRFSEYFNQVLPSHAQLKFYNYNDLEEIEGNN